MEVKYEEWYKYPFSIMLNLTDDCNLACKYCFVQQQPHYMTLDVAKNAIDFIVNNYNIRKKNNWIKENDKKIITFFGGEPMIMFDSIIVPLIEYIKENYNLEEFNFSITTNGTLLNEERIKFFKQNNFSILLSMDGAKETQDYNRPCKNCNNSSFDILQPIIPILLKYYPNIVFRSTVYKDTVNNLYNNFLYAESMGFKNYMAVTDARSNNWKEKELKLYKEELNKIGYHIYTQYLNNENPKMTCNNLNDALNQIFEHDINIIKNTKTNQLHQSRCGLGTGYCSINYQGDIFSCQEQDSREHGGYFYLGNIYNGIDKNKQIKLIKDYINSKGVCEKEEECLSCPIVNECKHGCISVQKDIFNNLSTKSYVNCKIEQHTLDICCLILQLLEDNELFQENLNKNIDKFYRGVKSGVRL